MPGRLNEIYLLCSKQCGISVKSGAALVYRNFFDQGNAKQHANFAEFIGHGRMYCPHLATAAA